MFHRKPYIIGSILFHLFSNCFCHHVSRQQLIYKTLFILIIKNRTFSTYRL